MDRLAIRRHGSSRPAISKIGYGNASVHQHGTGPQSQNRIGSRVPPQIQIRQKAGVRNRIWPTATGHQYRIGGTENVLFQRRSPSLGPNERYRNTVRMLYGTCHSLRNRTNQGQRSRTRKGLSRFLTAVSVTLVLGEDGGHTAPHPGNGNWAPVPNGQKGNCYVPTTEPIPGPEREVPQLLSECRAAPDMACETASTSDSVVAPEKGC